MDLEKETKKEYPVFFLGDTFGYFHENDQSLIAKLEVVSYEDDKVTLRNIETNKEQKVDFEFFKNQIMEGGSFRKIKKE